MERTASLVLFGLLMVTLGLGFAWSAAGPYYYRPPSGITWSGVSWHIYVSVLLIPLVVSHAIAYIRSFPLPLTFWVERRSFLRFAGIALAGLPLLADRRTSRAGGGPERQGPPFHRLVRGDEHQRGVPRGLVAQRCAATDRHRLMETVRARAGQARPVDIGYSDLTSNDEMTANHRLHRRLALRAGVARRPACPTPGRGRAAAGGPQREGHVRHRILIAGFTIAEAREYLLATHVGDGLLSPGTRIPRPPCRAGQSAASKWVKWVTDIEIDNRPKWLQPPLPLQ